MTDNPVQVSLVPKEYVHTVWDQVSGYLEEATNLTNDRYKVEDVLDLILQYGYMLWIAFDDSGIKGAVVTFVQEYPRKRYLYLMFCGGIEGMSWKAEMLRILQMFARDSHCDGLEATGRLGWSKIFRDDGLKSQWQVFELPLNSVELGV